MKNVYNILSKDKALINQKNNTYFIGKSDSLRFITKSQSQEDCTRSDIASNKVVNNDAPPHIVECLRLDSLILLNASSIFNNSLNI